MAKNQCTHHHYHQQQHHCLILLSINPPPHHILIIKDWVPVIKNALQMTWKKSGCISPSSSYSSKDNLSFPLLTMCPLFTLLKSEIPFHCRWTCCYTNIYYHCFLIIIILINYTG